MLACPHLVGVLVKVIVEVVEVEVVVVVVVVVEEVEVVVVVKFTERYGKNHETDNKTYTSK